MNLLVQLQERFADALSGVASAEKLPAHLANIKPASGPKHGDYQANFAMSLAKELGQKPRDIAQQVIDRLKADDMLEPPEIAGPGFINLRFKGEFLAKAVQAMEADERLGVAPASKAKTIVIDYSSPNVAKPLHVGHLRSTIIGDSLKRIFQFLGHRVIADNHLGDWGTQFGMMIYGYKNFRDEAALARDPIGEIVRLYQYVRQITKGREDDEGDVQRTPEEQAHYSRCLEETRKLQSGDPENVAIWRQFVQWTMATIDPLYKLLDVSFDCYHGESFYNPLLPGVVGSLLEQGIATRSQGAVVIFLKVPAEGEEPRADAVVQKRDGAFTYMTSDLACIQYRSKEWNPEKILYVVGTPQSQHFQTLFEAARRWGYDKVELRHINFGSVLGNDRKMLSTRNGGAAELGDLLAMAVAKGEEKYEQTRRERAEHGHEVPELSAEERRTIAERVGIGAVKYADLSQNRASDYVFFLDKMLSTEGNTATYMQYAFTRCQGIVREGAADPDALRESPSLPMLAAAQEKALALQLARFEETIQAAAQTYEPHHLTGYLWEVSRHFNRFYEDCPVLKAETPELCQSRLLLVDLTARVIRQSMELLGIRTMDRM
jgi:arginyl-tRNA synthetase